MNKKDYDKVMSYATTGELITILFWKPKRRLLFDTAIEEGKPFMYAYNQAKQCSSNFLNEWYNEHREAIKK